MKKLTIALLAIAAVAAPAQIKQTWTKSIVDPVAPVLTKDVAVSNSGFTYTVSEVLDTTVRITCHDGLGAQVWQKDYDNIESDGNVRILPSSDNNVLLGFTRLEKASVAKLDATNGTILWESNLYDPSSVNMNRVYDMASDGQGNVVVLGVNNSSSVIGKISPDGTVTNVRVAASGFYNKGLAVSANGQIYTLVTNASGQATIEALTPNFTLRYSNTWTPSFTGVVIASDRNGRVCTVEYKTGNNNALVFRTFNAAGTPTIVEASSPTRAIIEIRCAFDANGRFVVGQNAVVNSVEVVGCEWYGVTDSSVTYVKRATTPSTNSKITRVVADNFGQSYVSSFAGYPNNIGSVTAFDENRTAPVWSFTETAAAHPEWWMSCAVGAWGQVAMATTPGSPSYSDVNYIKQLGLRNLLINGQSFTGGRTITGTVNFYSSDTMARTVNLTSNTSYAVVTPSASVATGASQAGMSIDLKPTNVRRAVRIEGTFGGAKRSAVFYIEPPVASGLTVYPTSIKGGSNVNGSARINGAAPTGGMLVNLSSNDPAAVVPTSVTVAEGAVTKAFVVNTNVVSQTKTATLTATTGSTSKTATLTITP